MYIVILCYNNCIDSVEGLGDFVEIETLISDWDKADFYEGRFYGLRARLGLMSLREL